MSDEIRVLIISDIHYAKVNNPEHPRRHYTMGREMLRRAIEDAKRRGGPAPRGQSKFDAIAILGDICDSPGEEFQAALDELRQEIRKAAPDTPVLAIGGNHDADPAAIRSTFDAKDLAFTLAAPSGQAYRFVLFADPYGPGDVCTRSDADRRRLLDEAAAGLPLIVLQHNPMNPPIDDPYPYMLTNRDEVMSDYSRAGVTVSLSGHFHWGQDVSHVGGVTYFTAPALCEAPFRYAILTLSGRSAAVEVRRLQLPLSPALVDCHAHTEFAYCGTGISAPAVLERANLMGLAGVCLVEHAPQLYCLADDFWVGRHIVQPQLWREALHSRMAEFRSRIGPLRGPKVRVGLEIEVDCDYRLTVHDADRQWVDLLVGAIHWLPQDHKTMTEPEIIDTFLKATAALLKGGITVLAHPLRFFGWVKKPTPKEIYPVLADMLAEAGVAAEVNFHMNEPDAEFFAMCLDRGVRISFASDTHELHEAGAFWPHLNLLAQAAGGRNVDDLIFRLPPQKKQLP